MDPIVAVAMARGLRLDLKPRIVVIAADGDEALTNECRGAYSCTVDTQ